jgi:hypothetical protein
MLRQGLRQPVVRRRRTDLERGARSSTEGETLGSHFLWSACTRLSPRHGGRHKEIELAADDLLQQLDAETGVGTD